MYDLPPSVNRFGDGFSLRYWGTGCFAESDPIHTRRIYASQAHFDGHLLHDDYVRTLDPSRARLFYVPTFSRYVSSNRCPRAVLELLILWVRSSAPWWERSGGRDHVFFVPSDAQVGAP